MDENDQSEELQQREEQQQGQRPRPIDRINDLVKKQRNARMWANRARKMFGLGKSPATTVVQTVVKQVAASGARTALFAAGGSTFLLIILVILILLPPFATTGESAGLPGGGGIGDAPPLELATSCPTASKIVNCGSRARPINGPLGLCGHCGVGYGENSTLCSDPFSGISHAIDIDAPNGSLVYLPTILGETIQWTSLPPTNGSVGSIQSYNGVSPTGKQYRIEFHHAQPGSGRYPGTYSSGEAAARACTGTGCNNHIHVELGTGSSAAGPWLEAPDYLCRK